MAEHDNLESAVAAVERAHGKVRALSAESPGDSLFYEAENRLAAITLSLIGRLNNTRTAPSGGRADAAFYGRD
jgi:hypothetical protein